MRGRDRVTVSAAQKSSPLREVALSLWDEEAPALGWGEWGRIGQEQKEHKCKAQRPEGMYEVPRRGSGWAVGVVGGLPQGPGLELTPAYYWCDSEQHQSSG